jgi:enoyl-CoA hydratase
MELRDVLELEHALICRMMELPDLHAGVRARLGKTGEAPRWRPARLEDVSPATIDAIFSASEQHHLRLPTRREMQEGMM